MDESFKDLLEGMRRSFKDLFRRVAQLEMAGGKQIAVPGSGFSGSHDDLSDVSPDDHHDPVTLGSVAIENVLDLSTQDLTLDTQVANTVFAGPSAGADAEPTFRALVADDIPALTYLTAVGEGPGIDITGGDTVGIGGDSILLYTGDAPVAEFAATDAGLTAALAAATAGDVVALPACTIAGNHTIPADVIVTGMGEASTLSGTITNNGTIMQVKIGAVVILYAKGTLDGLVWDQANGRMGIGTDGPLAPLHIYLEIAGMIARLGQMGVYQVNLGGEADRPDITFRHTNANDTTVIRICPNGAPAGPRTTAALEIINTDFVADDANCDKLRLRFYNDVAYLDTGKTGTGTVRRLQIAPTTVDAGTTWAAGINVHPTTGYVTVNKTTAPTLPLEVSGSAEVSGFVQQAEQVVPATPAAGYGRTYPKADGHIWYINDAGAQFDLTLGSNSLPNAPQIIATNGQSGYATQHTMDAALVYGNGKTFAFYLGDDFDEWAVVYDHSTKSWGTPVEVADGHTSDDAHNYASAAIDSDGYLHIVYGCHVSDLYYKKSTNPYDVTAWSVEASLASCATYPKIVIDSNDNIYVVYREAAVGEGGGRYLRMRKSTNGGTSFAAAVTLVDSGSNDIWAYAGVTGLGSDDSLHVVWGWCDKNRSYVPSYAYQMYNCMYMSSPDGGTTWETSDGTDYSLPVTPATAEVVATGDYIFAQHVSVDGSNDPHVIYVVSDADVYFTENHIHYCYLSGGVWQDVTMPGQDYSFSSHILIDGTTFWIFSTQLIDGIREVVCFRSLDSGATWTFYQLTGGSSADNINVAVKKTATGGIELTWTSGTNVWAMNGDWIWMITGAEDADHGSLLGLGDDDHLQYLNETRHDLLDHTGLPGIDTVGKYRQFTYIVSGGDFSFVIDGDGKPVMALQELE